jgi:hypothetical protein
MDLIFSGFMLEYPSAAPKSPPAIAAFVSVSPPWLNINPIGYLKNRYLFHHHSDNHVLIHGEPMQMHV